ncbi:hypothetical protein ACFSW8_01875 [Rubritalea tangerina]|uniref:Autotransporter domain-containing protein n=2 Tax=Rubritalea tangerina TaxID=430798 RepID=A0ABW4Z711_9BACT
MKTQFTMGTRQTTRPALTDIIQSFALRVMVVLAVGVLWTSQVVLGQSDPPPPPPNPSKTTTTIGEAVTNPLTGLETTVSAVISDFNPNATPTTAFVQTADGYTFLVKDVNESFWPSSGASVGFKVLSNAAANTVTLETIPSDAGTNSTFSIGQTTTSYNSKFATSGGTSSTGEQNVTAPTTSGGLRVVNQGENGGNGSTGALFVPPGNGKNGKTPSPLDYTNEVNRVATANGGGYGIEAGSIGGNGGKGGDSNASPFSGGKGGTGASGGSVKLTNNSGVLVQSSGDGHHAIFAYSISGTGGAGGDGNLAPSGGTGGTTLSGGKVEVINNGIVKSNGTAAHGIYAISRSGNGGDGGTQIGLFGSSGSGGGASNGGDVIVRNGSTGSIETLGNYSHGIVANSVGGAGGDAGNSWNAFYSDADVGKGGGSGGNVSVTNAGSIVTKGDYSRGIFAQSVGGGGGSGGSAGGLVALGGTGSTGGAAGTASAYNTGEIKTDGIQSDGIFVQSVAGSGGDGGGSGGLVAVGGTGDVGGNGNTVIAENSGLIQTSLNLSSNSSKGGRGIVAQSIGGGGGDGGGTGGPVAVGGSGAGGGTGGSVTVSNTGEIQTNGIEATGILAQSIGGGGGNGGSAGSVSAFVGVAVGGKGGKGGKGGLVNVTQGGTGGNVARITTSGDRSVGLFAQSVGGGGGNGGGAFQATGGVFGAVSVAVGGQAGDGGAGDRVTLAETTGSSYIETQGADSAGVFLQSVGGGGGNGGYSIAISGSAGPASGSLSVGVGGKAGKGGDGGVVTVGNYSTNKSGLNGAIVTNGVNSTGFMAQSVGGGGGNGGSSVSVAASASLAAGGAVSVGVGGDGSDGGIGGDVTVQVATDIATNGANSTGLIVQSVGGGGGNGGGSVSAAVAGSAGVAGSVGVGLGGSGGSGNNGGEVKLRTGTSTILTTEENSTGILVQSVGGGGGNGGYSVSATLGGGGVGGLGASLGIGGTGGTGAIGGNVTAHLASDVVTQKDNSGGIVIQSIGGGGGNGGYNVSAALGGGGIGAAGISVGIAGSGSSGGSGGTVTASSNGAILTKGDNSIGLIAQSVGGSGGNGGFNVSASGGGGGVGAGAISVGLGGSGAAGGSGGVVNLSSSGDGVITEGANSAGIVAQSIGGGGGNGGFNVSAGAAGGGIGAGAVSVGLGGDGGSGAVGKTVTLNVSNDVTTKGENSTGVIAQSIGGGGGNGGFNVSAAISGAGIGSGAASVGLGGTGGNGNSGGTVNATYAGLLVTEKKHSIGFLAQSVGGGGGNGGFNVSAAGSGAGTGSIGATVGLGGDAGSGGIGGTVNASTSGAGVLTEGDYSHAIVAQSIGGGGGNGGFNVSGVISGAGVGSGSIAVGLGGEGGSGNTGGNVFLGTVNSDGSLLTTGVSNNVQTKGIGSIGVIAQSIGGGGGNGGFNVSGAASGAGTGSLGASIGLGGNGGTGGHAGEVVATMNGGITTGNDDAIGFLAQSVGGGGGNGSFNVSGTLSGAGTASGAVSVGLGGSGGAAGNASSVNAILDGAAINTAGKNAHGVVAQSIGGGGGNGGFNVSGGITGSGTGSGTVNVGLGGKGSGGGTASSVSLSVGNTVVTDGAGSIGVIAQSIGGGGGNGGFNVSAGASAAGTGSGSVSVGLGGSGGGGGTAGAVTAVTSGDVWTKQERSQGIVAQSIGGGGGNGGFDVSVAGSGAGTGSGAVSVSLGGNAGGGSSASSVGLTVNNNVQTEGGLSDAVVAQSIGGGGGNGGFSVSVAGSGGGTGSGAVGVGLGGSGGSGATAGKVTTRMTGNILTNGSQSRGLVSQSIGGGGGNGGFNVTAAISGAGTGSGAASVGIGGSGGTGGAGGEVDSELTGNVTTVKEDSGGVIAQSIGGGGGNGAMNVSGVISVAKSGSAGVSVGIGGSGGSGGTANIVTNKVTGNVITGGENSTGILAQSVGGGGGNGGINVSGTITASNTGAGGVSVGLGGSGGTGGTANTVTNTVIGDVTTGGKNASGVVAQSLGGGGGNGGMNISGALTLTKENGGAVGVGIGGSGGSGGSANVVNNTVTGNVITGGEGATGVIAQSLGGGGGNGGMNVTGAATLSGKNGASVGVGVGGAGGAGGTSAAVTNTVTGNVTTTGVNGDGIIAQSIGGGGGNGGVNVTGVMTLTKENGGSIGVGVGGYGGTAADGSTVFNTVTGNVATQSDDSTGILAQSLGGGGGSGGANVSGNLSLSGKSGGAIGVGLGGSGAGGGNAMRVDNYLTGNVQTYGENSAAVIAQSMGGGGGVGATNVTGLLSVSKETAGNIGVGIGGAGGGGGNAGVVFNQVQGLISTEGNDSMGVVAQSAGGGGGNGGLNVTGSITASVGKDGSTAGSLGVGIGGMGGGGGNGLGVTNNFTGTVATVGNNSTAILGQSLGGGGGNGGLNVTGSITASLKGNSGSLGVGIGGFGGGGGDAGAVNSTVVVNPTSGLISTTGDGSMGVVAQSLGGGGGNGGLNVTGALNYSDDAGGAVGFGLGGFGGSGGDAGIVNLDVSGNVLTTGSNASAVMAQSLAGGGGNGGLNVTGGLSYTSNKNSSVASIGIGGFGGGGGDAKDVRLKFNGQINNPWTNGTDPDSVAKGSHGVIAQSLGGGGGNGGLNVAGGVSYSSQGEGNALVVGIGGFGGTGGNAGNVGVTVEGNKSITAHGDSASAIFAQSLGGGGGNGGFNVSGGFTSSAPVIFGLGGLGGNAGTAGNVSVVANANLYANGTEVQNSDRSWIENTINEIGVGLSLVDEDDDPDLVGRSTGITAQSIGGGGGNGGFNVSGGGAFNSKDTSSSLVFGVGGFGGAAAVSGEVTVDHTGSITTVGDWGHGILAQSLAGGGGNGGVNVTASANWTSNPNNSSQDFSMVGGIGGFGGAGADSKKVEVTSVGNITTTGSHSRGILAQSIGGGGGTGGLNVTSNITKKTSPMTLGIGGFGGGGGHAGDVTVNRGTSASAAGLITTNGTSAHGVEASSIGGGGGNAGANFSLSYSSAGSGANKKKNKESERTTPKNTGVDDSVIANYNNVLDELEGRNQDTSSTGKKAYAAQLMIGGAGGVPGNGGIVDVNHYGDITTLASNSHGILAQSIGGGGGNANFNVAYNSASNVDKSFDIAIGGATGDGGIGGVVTVDHLGVISTTGDQSVGVFGQSVGGGGGNAGMDMASTSNSAGNYSVSLGRMGGTGGAGGNVTIVSDGGIFTTGKESHGILAQSVGNGGGNSSSVSFSGSKAGSSDDEPNKSLKLAIGLEGGVGGEAGVVDVDASGRISTTGESAHGVFAQSVGGGGGNGGSATLGSKSPWASGTQSIGLAVGGTGGTGGKGGLVTLVTDAIITTEGEGAVGVLAQSVGGGGGTGGKSMTTGKLKNNGNVSVNIGGAGGTGSEGGDVQVNASGVIVTDGVGSHGVLAQTVGGGGGLAGMTIGALYNKGTNSSTNVDVKIGGAGGDSNSKSGAVTLNNTGAVETFEASSVGLFGQSIGGGGGDARLVTSITVGTGDGKGTNNNFSLAVGGTGGEGGTGGDVTINNTDIGSLNSGLIVTHGHGSHGIAGMSIGGGGGEGSAVTNLNRSKMDGTTRSLSIGGSGGKGGTSGTVNIDNQGTIITFGDAAHGILAQSVGGGGGNAGDVITINSRPEGQTAQAISIGGKGGNGNTAGNVNVLNSGSINTKGKASYGILAQSVGGGGGNGSIAIANPKSAAKTLSGGSMLNSLSLGGFAGTGDDSGDVYVKHDGTITVEGDNSYGIYAQSVGGGGGSIGASIGSPASSLAATGLQLTVGALQSQGQAGKVTLDVTGDIFVTGTNSQAIFQQTVNGGGGDVNTFMDLTDSAAAFSEDSVDAPDNLSVVEHFTSMATDIVLDLGGQEVLDAKADAVEYVQNGNILNFGDSSSGNTVQTVGGGGGQSYIDLTHYEGQQVDSSSSLGGSDSTNSSGGDIMGQRSGNVTVVGDGSVGSNEQSIGGGGGMSAVVFKAQAVPGGGVSVDPIVSLDSSFGLLPLAVPVPSGVTSLTTQLGASGGSGNDGGAIVSTMAGDVTTSGDRSPGIIRQSIGAGGGIQQIAGAGEIVTTLGGVAGASGNGGSISLTNVGNVVSDGMNSHGIVLQSIGGGGGLQLSDSTADQVQLSLSTDNSGNGGGISLDQTGDVIVTADGAYGVLVQSLGGGGGAVDRVFAGSAGGSGTSGAVALNLKGDVVASGSGAVAVFAQSQAADGQGDIMIELPTGKMIAAGAGGTAVWMSGGAENSFVSRGALFTDDGLAGSVIRGEDGNDRIESYDTFLGQFDLGSGANQFTNHEGGTFIPGQELSLGDAANQLFNNGEIMIGGMNNAQRTNLSGGFVQGATGVNYTELDFAGPGAGVIDQVYATGSSSLGGEMVLTLLNPQLVPSGSFSQVLLESAGGVENNGMVLTTAPSVVVTYDLTYPTANAAVLNYKVDFSPDDQGPLGPNLQAVGDYFNRVQAAGSSPDLADTVIKLLYDPNLAAYKESLSQMSPDFYGELQANMIRSSERFGHLLVDGGDHRIFQHDRYLWVNYENESTQHKAYDDYKEANGQTNKVAFGVQQSMKDGWIGGLGISIEDHKDNGYGDRWQADGETHHVGLIAKKYYDRNIEFASALTYGWGNSDVTRYGGVTQPFTTNARRDLRSFSGMLRVAQLQDQVWGGYLRPMAALGFTHLRGDGVTENGAGPISLTIQESEQTHVWSRLGLELGRVFDIPSDFRLQVSGKLGFQYYITDGATDVYSGLLGAPVGISPMRVGIDLNDTHGFGSLGLQLINSKEYAIGVEYGTILHKYSRLDRWDVGVRIPF